MPHSEPPSEAPAAPPPRTSSRVTVGAAAQDLRGLEARCAGFERALPGIQEGLRDRASGYVAPQGAVAAAVGRTPPGSPMAPAAA